MSGPPWRLRSFDWVQGYIWTDNLPKMNDPDIYYKAMEANGYPMTSQNMTDPHAPEGNTDYTTGAPPNDTVGMRQSIGDPAPGSGHEIPNPMAYIDTDDPGKIAAFKHVNDAAFEMYQVILGQCVRSAERTLAIRKLQEARMWANAAIAFDGRTYKT